MSALSSILEELEDNWLELSAGREAFLTASKWRGLNKQGVAWGDMVSPTPFKEI